MVYLIVDEEEKFCKIGHSKDPQKRLQSLQSSSPCLLYLSYVIRGGKELERKLHDKFSHHRVRGEWYKCVSSIFNLFEERGYLIMSTHLDYKDPNLEADKDGNEPMYVSELFIKMIAKMNNAEVRVMCYILENFIKAKFSIDSSIKKHMVSDLKISSKTIPIALHALRERSLILQFDDGSYIVNPKYFFKTSMQERLKLLEELEQLGCTNC
jgi:hypothetical protein